ncbi:tetratricopeptide repeat protein [Vibrio sp. 10N.261.51.F12]|uniref:tetratricopeptide repeat protein n=1 Tax=Vibrio sp. 10N.261.51.F12 TaxID=3229679 RepID=UPI00354B3D32
MKKRLTHLSLLLTCCLSFSFSQVAVAKQELGMRTATQVSKAYELEQQEKLTEAIALLETLKPSASFDKAYVARMLGIYYWQADKTDLAIKQLQIAVNTHAFKDDQGWQTERMLAELLLSDTKAEQSLVHFERLVTSAEALEIPKAQLTTAWLNKARAHYLLQQWAPLLASINQYHRLDSTPKLQPLSLQLSAELQLSRLKSAIITSQKLLALQPEKMMWWQQLSALYMQTKQYKLALATLVSAKRAGIDIPDTMQLSMAQLYAQQGIPEKSAHLYRDLQLSDTDVDTIVKQATHWQMAREWTHAQTSWLAAARLNAKYYEQVSRLEMQQGDFKQALQSLDKVKGLTLQEKQLLQIRAYVGLKQYATAKTLAESAHKAKPTTQTADWLNYLDQMTQ